jgi:outer membrane protein assembly factor BamB
VGISLSVQAADWHQWRGPNRNGIATDSPKLADKWGKKGPELVWQTAHIPSGGDGGFGSFAVVKDKVYFLVNWKAYQGKPGAQDVIMCLDVKTGTTLWEKAFPGQPFGCGSSSTPCVVGGKVFVAGGSALYGLDAATGEELWQVTGLVKELSSSPVIADGVLVVCTGTLKGFDPADGKELWECKEAGNGNGNNTSPAIWKNGNRELVIVNMGKLTCVNPKDGSVVWQSEDANCNSTPSISGDICIVGSHVSGFKLMPDKAEKIFGTGLGDRGASQILHNDHVFAYSGGALRCLDLTGKQLWEQGFGGEVSSPVIADGKIFAVCGDNKLVMAPATSEKPAKFYEARIPTIGCASPAVRDGKLFVRLAKAVGCYDLTKIAVDPSTMPPRVPENPGKTADGLKVDYYVGGSLDAVLNLDKATPVKTGTATQIDRSFAEVGENYGLKFTGYISVPRDGEYTFYTKSDDGSKLFIGKLEVVDNDGAHGSQEQSGCIQLKAGKHAVRVYFTQMGGGADLSASYEGQGIAKTVIPANVLFRDPE